MNHIIEFIEDNIDSQIITEVDSGEKINLYNTRLNFQSPLYPFFESFYSVKEEIGFQQVSSHTWLLLGEETKTLFSFIESCFIIVHARMLNVD